MKFSKTHEWVEIDEAGKVAKVGISRKALSELGEIVFIQLPKEGQILSDDEPMADQQPVLLSSKAAASEGVDCVFLIDGEEMEITDQTQRCIVMINGRSQDDIGRARKLWKRLKDAGETLSYWQQTDRGKWEKKA